MTDEEETLQRLKTLAFEVDKALQGDSSVTAYLNNQKLIQAIGKRQMELKKALSGSLTTTK